MTLQELIPLAVKLSIILTVLAIGLKSSFAALTHLFNRPAKLATSLLAIDVIMPLFAIALVLLMPALPGPVKLALIALSVAPVPPLFPKKASKSSTADDYSVGLLVAVAVVAIVFVPVAIEIIGPIFGIDLNVSFTAIASLMIMMILVPLLVGAATHALWPDFAERAGGLIGKFATILLIAAVLPILYLALPQALAMARDGTILALGAFVLVGLAVGHLLGGPDQEDRTVLALATASRHPGVAMAVAAASFPAAQKEAIVAIALYLVVNALFGMPYVLWRKRRQATDTHHHPAE